MLIIFSFKLNSALLSRCRVFVLNRLSEEELYQIVARALKVWRSEEAEGSESDEVSDEDKEALLQLAKVSDGDGNANRKIMVEHFNALDTKVTMDLCSSNRIEYPGYGIDPSSFAIKSFDSRECQRYGSIYVIKG